MVEGTGRFRRAMEYAAARGITWDSVLTVTRSGYMEFVEDWKEEMAEPIWASVVPEEVLASEVMDS